MSWSRLSRSLGAVYFGFLLLHPAAIPRYPGPESELLRPVLNEKIIPWEGVWTHLIPGIRRHRDGLRDGVLWPQCYLVRELFNTLRPELCRRGSRAPSLHTTLRESRVVIAVECVQNDRQAGRGQRGCRREEGSIEERAQSDNQVHTVHILPRVKTTRNSASLIRSYLREKYWYRLMAQVPRHDPGALLWH